MTVTMRVETTQPASLFISWVSVPEGGSLHSYLPVFACADDPGDLRNLHPSSGGVDYPVMSINGSAPLGRESETWGSLKALYR